MASHFGGSVRLSAILVVLVLGVSISVKAEAQSRDQARTFGDCILDPDAKGLQDQWKILFEYRLKRAKVNIQLLPKKLFLPEAGRELIEAVLSSEPLLEVVRKIESRFLKNAFHDKKFNLLVSDPAFLEKIRNGAAQEEIRESDLPFKDQPEFLALLREVEEILSRPEVIDALDVFRKNDLGILDPAYRESARKSLAFLSQKGANPEMIRGWRERLPLMAEVPLPPSTLGAFALKYRSILSSGVEEFIGSYRPSFDEARLVIKKLKPEDWSRIEAAEPPTERNAFDQHVLSRAWVHRDAHQAFSLSTDEYGAIDGVARTLWGEASSCQNSGYRQFEAISKIIADRALSIERARDESGRIQAEKTEVREKNWVKFLKNWVGIKRAAGGMQADPSQTLRGMADFGRKEKVNLDAAAQVISRKGQFSVWNSFTLKKFRVKSLHRNLPDATYSIQGPQSSQDDQALTRILCPEFQNEKQKELWSQAESLARDLVLNRKRVSETYRWPTADTILFYTHEASLPFAREVRVSSLVQEGKKLKINGRGGGPCSHFRLFAPKGGQRY